MSGAFKLLGSSGWWFHFGDSTPRTEIHWQAIVYNIVPQSKLQSNQNIQQGRFVVQSPSWDPIDCSTLGFPVPHHLPEFTQVHIHCIGDTVQPSHPLSPSSSAFNLFLHQGWFFFSSESVVCIRQPKYWSFSFSISLSKEYSWLISFRIDGFDLLAVQETLKSLLQHRSPI